MIAWKPHAINRTARRHSGGLHDELRPVY